MSIPLLILHRKHFIHAMSDCYCNMTAGCPSNPTSVPNPIVKTVTVADPNVRRKPELRLTWRIFLIAIRVVFKFRVDLLKSIVKQFSPVEPAKSDCIRSYDD